MVSPSVSSPSISWGQQRDLSVVDTFPFRFDLSWHNIYTWIDFKSE